MNGYVTVRLMPDGRLNVESNIESKVLAVGLLEMGKAALMAPAEQQKPAGPRIALASGPIPLPKG